MNQFDQLFNQYLNIDNEHITSALSLILVLYAGYAAPQLPKSVAMLMDNVFVKLVIFFGLAYMSNKNPTVALISAVAVLATLQTIEKYNLYEQLTLNMSAEEQKTENIMNKFQENNYNDDVNQLAEEEELMDSELDSQPEMIVSDNNETPNHRNEFYPQYVDALPQNQTYETRNVGEQEGDSENSYDLYKPNYASA